MSNTLKIYACSGVGDNETQQQSSYNYWTDNTRTIYNTQAVNSLLALINLNYCEILNLKGMGVADKIANYNDIDLYSVCLYFAQEYSNNTEELHKAGEVIGYMLQAGEFDFESLDNNERDNHLDELISHVSELLQEDITTSNVEFTKWWKKNVEDLNTVGLSEQSQQAIEEELTSKVGDLDYSDNPELSKYLNNSGSYFLYIFFSNKDIKKLPKVLQIRRDYEKQVYNYCKGLYTKMYGTEQQMLNVIRTGIIGEYKSTPEEICASIIEEYTKSSVKGIGEIMIGAVTLTVFLEIMSLVASFVIGIVKVICDAVVRTNEAKYAALDNSIINGACPNPEDINGIGNNLKTKKDISTILPFAAIGAALLLLFRK